MPPVLVGRSRASTLYSIAFLQQCDFTLDIPNIAHGKAAALTPWNRQRSRACAMLPRRWLYLAAELAQRGNEQALAADHR